MKEKITAILAMTPERVIWKDNSLAWSIPEDLKYFREITSWGVVIMGKNTFFSLPEKFRPLPNRRNIIFTHGSIEWVECVQDFWKLQEILQGEIRKIFLIGGASLYNYFFENDYIDTVKLTLLKENFSWNIYINEFRDDFIEIDRKEFSQWFFLTLKHK